MSRRSGSNDVVTDIGSFFVFAAIMAACGVLYGLCLTAIHLSITIVAKVQGSQSPKVKSKSDALMLAVIVASLWATVMVVACLLITGSLDVLYIALVIIVPFSIFVGWQVWLWNGSRLSSHQLGSVSLGHYRDQLFHVKHQYVIPRQERLKHMVVHGPTGSGKSTLLKNLILNDIKSGAGLCAIDPKDNLIDDIIPHIPQHRWKDVILLDATDRERPLGFNPLSGIPAERRSLAASETISVLRRYFSDSWGARLEHILTNVLLALLETPNATLLDVRRLLLDADFRLWVVEHVTNPGVQQFFLSEFEPTLSRRSDTVSPILNKVGPWITYPELRCIIGQSRSSFSLRDVMDSGKILLVRIPEGTLGESISSLLGALIVAKIQMAAHSRADVPESRRRPFYLYVDEFQNFATSSFAKILVEARSFKLGLICANQYPEQLTRDLQLAIDHNVATNVQCFRQDGRYRIQVSHLEATNSPQPNILVPFGPPTMGDNQTARQIRLLSRTKYGRDKREVEERILRRLSGLWYQTRLRTSVSKPVDIDEE